MRRSFGGHVWNLLEAARFMGKDLHAAPARRSPGFRSRALSDTEMKGHHAGFGRRRHLGIYTLV